jgi:hypothetical protein
MHAHACTSKLAKLSSAAVLYVLRGGNLCSSIRFELYRSMGKNYIGQP